MAKKHYTSLGEQIDMSALAIKHSQTVALGNARMNARGDILGNGGVVLRTQEQIESEWKRTQTENRDLSGISANIKDPLPASMTKGKRLTEDRDFDPAVADSSVPAAATHTAVEDQATNGAILKELVEKQATGNVPPRRRKIVDSD
jgi:hypothetical protein